MKFNCLRPALLSGCLSLAVLLFGCAAQQAGGGSTRKKYPELNSLGVGEEMFFNSQSGGSSGFPFLTGDVDVQMGNGISAFFSVTLSDPALDSLAMNLLVNYESMALPLLSQLATEEKKGVLIDLRGKSGVDGHRADFFIDHGRDFSIPVVFLWDRSSAGRAAGYMNILKSYSSLRCRASDFIYNGQQNNF